MRSHSFSNWNLLLKCFLFLVVIIYTIKSIEADNHFLKKYSKISYDKHELTESHNRAKRSVDNKIRLKFESHGKKFDLELKKSQSSIEKDLIHFADGASSSQHDLTLYEGHLVDEPNDSYVSGTILDGTFIGSIRSKAHGNYYVEPSQRFENSSDSHAIIYHEEDIQIKKSVGCGLSYDHVQEALAKQQTNFVQTKEKKNHQPSSQKSDYEVKVETRSYKYSQVANGPKREKRQSSSQLPFPDQKSVCSLYLRIDPYLYDYILKREGNNDAKLTENYILFYVNEQVASLNAIFNSIRFFNGSRYYSGVEFKINRIKIFKLSDCSGSTLNEAEKNLCINYLDSTTLLNYISLDNFENYCLSFTFTSRDFSDGTLGLAWLASNTGAAGGVCQNRVSVQGVEKSLNSGLVTLVNYNSRIPARVNQITFVHEVGHTFGSSHDNATCTPGNTGGGNYIMYSRATTATLPNNDDFSPCSLEKMGQVFTYVVQNKFCFQKASQAICGNRIVEPGEQCDCGFLNECDDSCCNSTTCQLNLGAQCSPSQGPCCNSTCRFQPASKVCQRNNDCLQDVFCSGTSSTCPRGNSAFFKPDNTTCNSGTQLCRNGTCQGSICEVYNMQQCYLEGDLSDSTVDKSSLCHLACVGARTNNKCMDTADISGFGGLDRTGYTLRPGSPCAGTQGYCDVFGKCRSVNSEGVLSKLLETLTAPQEITIEDVKRWVQKYWWAILIFCIIFMAFNALILACIIIHMRSDNPEKKQSRSFLDTLKAPLRMCSRNQKGKSTDNKRKNSKNPRIIPKFDQVNMGGPREVIPISTFSTNNRSNSKNDRRPTPDYNSDE